MPGTIKLNRLLCVCLLTLVASGCAEVSTMYQGNPVSSVHVVPLQKDGPTAGQWETFDMTIDYDYSQDDDELVINGQVVLSLHHQMTYDRLWRLDVYLFFVDENSQVLETYYFVRTTGRVPDERMDASQRYKIPPKATGLSFGYSGVVGESRSRTNFYLLPLSK